MKDKIYLVNSGNPVILSKTVYQLRTVGGTINGGALAGIHGCSNQP